MKTILLIFSILTIVIGQSFSQTPDLISASATEEGAITVRWTSKTNSIYRIEYADELLDQTTVWNTLYDYYPTHGTNTFWLDTGDYLKNPAVPHPSQVEKRFYRIAEQGENNWVNPTVSIISPTNGASLSGEITVSVSASVSSGLIVRTILYVDGQEMPSSEDGTNFVINTCEWPNGPHTLFAVAKSQSDLAMGPRSTPVSYGSKTSDYVDVTFDNLITRLAFSQPFFEPDLGQTQRVSAIFTANVDWTLEIQDEDTNTVRTVTGSGGTLSFDWDGTGTGGTNIPNGVYTYLVTVETNGQALAESEGGGGGSEGPPSPDSASFSEDFGSDIIFDLPPLPPGLSYGQDEKGAEITTMSVSRPSLLFSTAFEQNSLSGGNGAMANAFGGSSQSTRGPKRPPANPIKGSVGKFGIAYKTYPNTNYVNSPTTGAIFPLQTRVALDGYPVTSGLIELPPLIENKEIANSFHAGMLKKSWKSGFLLQNEDFNSTTIKKSSTGGSNIFNTVNIGFLLGHGSYGTTTEIDGIKYTYFWLGTGTSQALQYLRLSDFNFGSPGTNGLRWMTVFACHMLNDANYTLMNNHSKLPINSDLHLLSSTSTEVGCAPYLGEYYAKYLTSSRTVPNAWVDAGTDVYNIYRGHMQNPVPMNFRVAGWSACFSDTLKVYYAPNTGNGIQYVDENVFLP